MALIKKSKGKGTGVKPKSLKKKVYSKPKRTKSNVVKTSAVKAIGAKSKSISKHTVVKPKTVKTKQADKLKVSDTNATNGKARSIELEKELAALKEETASLQAENARIVEKYGQMLEVSTNIKFKANAMLGQILKALYIMGIGPDDILAKCQQMFRKKVVAD
jgi:hypothetical protein